MKVVIAPDKFAGSMDAPEAAGAFERGWRSVRPHDQVERVPLSDGGPGFIDCLETSLPGHVHTIGVTGPKGTTVAARVFVAETTWYIEAAQANGLHLVPVRERDPWRSTTAGVGELVQAAVSDGAQRVIVGLGGSATNDGGSGMLGALGARAWDAAGAPVDLTLGPAELGGIASLGLDPARQRVSRLAILIASDVDNPLLGVAGASRMFGPQKGADDVFALESALAHWVSACVGAGVPEPLARSAGAGAAGGLGYGLLILGGHRTSGIDLVVDAVGLRARCADADLVVTGEGRFDEQSLHGKVVTGVVEAAGTTPVLVIAGQSDLAPDKWRRAGIARVETLRERAVSTDDAIEHGASHMESVAAAVAAGISSGRRRPGPQS